MHIIGLDPGLADTGWGVIKKDGAKSLYIAHGCITTGKDEGLEGRLLTIYNELIKILTAYRPQAAAIENLYFSKNSSSALEVAHARGVLMLALAGQHIKVNHYAPNTIKLAVTGYGKADKATVQAMVKLLLGLAEIPKPNHAADALAMALCCANLL
ncbi:MAG: crossover junction endodeoxyribonuclease RuvC [Spirochaetaceae bacterium]|nr:crossover junction endodeoxyribonuclease RuvC [Spirochaetaceae bacterium]